MKTVNRILWGIVIIALGILFALNAFGVKADLFFEGWWTLFIIVPCTIGLITEHDKTGNLLGILLGVALLLGCRDILDLSTVLKLAVPVALILFGLKMVFGGLFCKKEPADNTSAPETTLSKWAAFGAQSIRHAGPFGGGRLTALFGGIDCDLRDAEITEDCTVEVCALFGGVDIMVPDHINIKLSTTALFGGVEDKKHACRTADAPTLEIRGFALFGGVDIL